MTFGNIVWSCCIEAAFITGSRLLFSPNFVIMLLICYHMTNEISLFFSKKYDVRSRSYLAELHLIAGSYYECFLSFELSNIMIIFQCLLQITRRSVVGLQWVNGVKIFYLLLSYGFLTTGQIKAILLLKAEICRTRNL